MAATESGTRVCIIGAGPSGLCSLRHALDTKSSTNIIQAVIFEQQADVGGIWNYSGPEVKLWDAAGNPMIFPMYNELKCNLPRQLMEFRDFKQKDYTRQTFATQQELHDYLVEYADHYRLWPYIKVNSRVVNVKPKAQAGPTTLNSGWIVTVENTRSFELNSYTFDAIMCCVGVNYYPKIPDLPGMTRFQGPIIHSKYFKNSQDFRDKRVVLLGLGPSSADLSLKLAPIAKSVTVCHRHPGGFSLGLVPSNVMETSSITGLNARSVTTEENEDIPCDALILCTGYEPGFPFLDSANLMLSSSSNNLEEQANAAESPNDIIYRLYNKIIVPNYPTFCFINAHGLVSEFLVMEVQAKYFLGYLQRKVSLPPVPVMERCAKRESRKLRKNRTQGKLTEPLRGDRFALSKVQQYLETLAVEGGFAPDFRHIPLHLALWQFVIQRIFGNLKHYRGDCLKVLTPNIWEYTYTNGKDEQGNEVEGKRVVKIFKLNPNGSVSIMNEQA